MKKRADSRSDLQRISTALAIHSLAGFLPRSLFTHLLDFYRTRYSLTCWISTALAIHSLAGFLPRSLFTHLLVAMPSPILRGIRQLFSLQRSEMSIEHDAPQSPHSSGVQCGGGVRDYSV